MPFRLFEPWRDPERVRLSRDLRHATIEMTVLRFRRLLDGCEPFDIHGEIDDHDASRARLLTERRADPPE